MILPFIIPTISSWDISKPFLHHQEVSFMTHYPLLKVAIPNGGLFHLQHQSTVQNTSTKEINKMETNNECMTKLYKNNMSKNNVWSSYPELRTAMRGTTLCSRMTPRHLQSIGGSLILLLTLERRPCRWMHFRYCPNLWVVNLSMISCILKMLCNSIYSFCKSICFHCIYLPWPYSCNRKSFAAFQLLGRDAF